MSRQLTWSIVADGGTDLILVPVIQWAIHRLDPDVDSSAPAEVQTEAGEVLVADADAKPTGKV